MNEIKVAENKTLKLTNVLSRVVRPEELGNLSVILTQMQNFIKSNNAQPIGPLVQAIRMGTGPDHVPEMYMMQQATQMISKMEPGYHMDAVLRVKNCLYAHYTGPLSKSQLASAKLQIMAFENDIKLTDSSYTIYVNQDDDEAVIDVFMETK
jgi:effector-binding domain-containing protein